MLGSARRWLQEMLEKHLHVAPPFAQKCWRETASEDECFIVAVWALSVKLGGITVWAFTESDGSSSPGPVIAGMSSLASFCEGEPVPDEPDGGADTPSHNEKRPVFSQIGIDVEFLFSEGKNGN